MSRETKGDTRTAALVALALAAATFAVFGQAVGFELVNYDDPEYVANNAHVTAGLTWAGARWAFTEVHSANWHPLTWLSHMLDAELFGDWAGGHHLTSVALHAATVVTLFLAMRRVSGRLWPSALTAALFAVHPLRAESVAWVSERKDVLSGLCFALTLLAYAGYVRRPFAAGRYALVLLAFALGLLAKPMLVTLPVVLLLLDVWPLGRLRPFGWGQGGERALDGPGHPLLEKLPLFALTAASCAVTVLAQRGALSTLDTIPLGLRLQNAVLATAVYLKQLAFPTGLSVFYPLRGGLSPVAVGAAAALLVAVTAAAVALRRRAPYALVGWAWYLAMLAPVVGVVQVGSQAHADRYTYLPEIGVALALSFGLADLARTVRARRVAVAASGAVLVVLAALATRQVAYWKDSVTLWSHAAEVAPDNALAWHLLAGGYVGRGQDREALPCYRRAAELRPDHVYVQSGLAAALKRLGRHEEAVAAMRRVCELDPGSLIAANNLAWFLATTPVDGLRDGREAVVHAERAAELAGDGNFTVLDTLAAAYAEAGAHEAAARTQRRAIELAPPAERPALERRLELYLAGSAWRDPTPRP